MDALPHRANIYGDLEARDETMTDLVQRMFTFTTRLALRHQNETVCCVGHGDPIASLSAHIKGAELNIDSIRKPHHPELCSATHLCFRSGSDLPSYDYVDVLGKLAPDLKPIRR